MTAPHRLLRWIASGLLCGSLLPVLPAAAADDPPVPTRDAAGWIARLNSAATEHNYRGTMVYSAAGVVSSSRVAHVCTGDEVFERVEALDGQQHRVYRHNDSVQTVWPHKRVVVVEQRSAATALVSTRRRIEPRALEHYTLTAAGQSVVAGRRAQVLTLQPLDDLRFAQRLLADEATGLLLRVDVLDGDGRVLESSAFSEVAIGGSADAKAVLEGINPAGYQVLNSRRENVDWAALGWRLRQAVPGFELVGCVRRPAVGRSGEGTALQAMFSDGLSIVSLFIEPYSEQAHRRALAAGLGATHTVMQRIGDHWITAMGDVPRRTLEHFVGALEHH